MPEPLRREEPAPKSRAPELREYQRDVVARVASEITAGRRRILLVAPTASGKMVIAGELVRDAIGRGMRVLAHRRELIGQASRKLHAVGVVDHGILLAGYTPQTCEPVQVASVGTLHAGAESASVAELTTLGFLVPARIYAPTKPDLTGVRVERGDYVAKDLAQLVDTATLVGDVIEHWHRLAERRRTVVFASGVAHSVHLRDEFRRSGAMAEHIDGATPLEERDAILARLAAGSIEVVCNAMVLTEGWDCPEVACLVLARPTKSLGLYRQMVGRVLRPAPGKADALILDHAGAVFARGFPDDPINWTLAEDKRAENKAHSARETYRAPALTTCPECAAVRFEGRPCTVCGWRPRPKAAPAAVADGELGQVERNRTVKPAAYTADQRTRFFRMLVFIAQERGYKAGWAAHKFKEKFRDWPASRFVEPLPPDEATRSWVRCRQMAFARAMAKAGAA